MAEEAFEKIPKHLVQSTNLPAPTLRDVNGEIIVPDRPNLQSVYFTIDGVRYQHNVVVCTNTILHSCILGIDFLIKCSAIQSLIHKNFETGQYNIQLNSKTEKRKPSVLRPNESYIPLDSDAARYLLSTGNTLLVTSAPQDLLAQKITTLDLQIYNPKTYSDPKTTLLASPIRKDKNINSIQVLETMDNYEFMKSTFPVKCANDGNVTVSLPAYAVIASLNDFTPILNNPLPNEQGSKQKVTEEDQKIIWDIINSSETPIDKRQIIFELICEFRDIFSIKESDPIGTTHIMELEIDTGDAPPVYKRNFPMDPAKQKIVEAQAAKWLKDGIISYSTTPWNSPHFLVYKKSGEARLVLDLRGLNEVTKPQHHPLPLFADYANCLHGSKIFTTLDLSHAFLQVPIAEKDREKVGWSTLRSKYEFNKVAFGLTNGPALLQRVSSLVLKDLLFKTCCVFFDDILVYTKDISQHMDNIREVLNHLRAANLKIGLKKCEFFRTQVEYLGMVMTTEGVKPSKRHLKSVADMPIPDSPKAVRAFLGLINFQRSLIKNLSQKCHNLYKLTKKDAPFIWSEKCQEEYDNLKKELTSSSLIAYPDFSRPFIVSCDASGYGLGAILSQVDKDSQERIVCYASRTLVKAETVYSATDLEFLAVYFAVKSFEQYLSNPFIVYSDHRPLISGPKIRSQCARHNRYIEYLSHFKMDLKYRAGKDNPADFLSRHIPPDVNKKPQPEPETGEGVDTSTGILELIGLNVKEDEEIQDNRNSEIQNKLLELASTPIKPQDKIIGDTASPPKSPSNPSKRKRKVAKKRKQVSFKNKQEALNESETSSNEELFSSKKSENSKETKVSSAKGNDQPFPSGKTLKPNAGTTSAQDKSTSTDKEYKIVCTCNINDSILEQNHESDTLVNQSQECYSRPQIESTVKRDTRIGYNPGCGPTTCHKDSESKVERDTLNGQSQVCYPSTYPNDSNMEVTRDTLINENHEYSPKTYHERSALAQKSNSHQVDSLFGEPDALVIDTCTISSQDDNINSITIEFSDDEDVMTEQEIHDMIEIIRLSYSEEERAFEYVTSREKKGKVKIIIPIPGKSKSNPEEAMPKLVGSDEEASESYHSAVKQDVGKNRVRVLDHHRAAVALSDSSDDENEQLMRKNSVRLGVAPKNQKGKIYKMDQPSERFTPENPHCKYEEILQINADENSLDNKEKKGTLKLNDVDRQIITYWNSENENEYPQEIEENYRAGKIADNKLESKKIDSEENEYLFPHENDEEELLDAHYDSDEEVHILQDQADKFLRYATSISELIVNPEELSLSSNLKFKKERILPEDMAKSEDVMRGYHDNTRHADGFLHVSRENLWEDTTNGSTDISENMSMFPLDITGFLEDKENQEQPNHQDLDLPGLFQPLSLNHNINDKIKESISNEYDPQRNVEIPLIRPLDIDINEPHRDMLVSKHQYGKEMFEPPDLEGNDAQNHLSLDEQDQTSSLANDEQYQDESFIIDYKRNHYFDTDKYLSADPQFIAHIAKVQAGVELDPSTSNPPPPTTKQFCEGKPPLLSFGSTQLQILEAQKLDNEIRDIRERLSTKNFAGTIRTKNTYLIPANFFIDSKNFLLYKIISKGEKQESVLVLPRKMITQAICHAHQNLLGHMGVEKTLLQVKALYHFPGMYSKVLEFVLSCDLCQRRKSKLEKEAEQGKAIRATRPFEVLALDLMGELPSDRANPARLLLTCIDIFTKYAFAFPIPDKTTDTVVRCLVNNILLIFGCPRMIQIDNGKEFTSDLFRAVADVLHIQLHHSLPYNSRGNAQVERLNKNLRQSMGMYKEVNQARWQVHIPYCVLAYNISIHSVTNESPFFLMFMRDIRLPIHEIVESRDFGRYTLDETPASFKAEMVMQTQIAFHTAQELMEEAALKTADRFNKTAWTRSFEVGEIVMHYNKKVTKGQCKQLYTFWNTFRIIEKINEVSYRIAQLYTAERTIKIVHVNTLKRYRMPVRGDENPGQDEDPDDQPEASGSSPSPSKKRKVGESLQDEDLDLVVSQEDYTSDHIDPDEPLEVDPLDRETSDEQLADTELIDQVSLEHESQNELSFQNNKSGMPTKGKDTLDSEPLENLALGKRIGNKSKAKNSKSISLANPYPTPETMENEENFQYEDNISSEENNENEQIEKPIPRKRTYRAKIAKRLKSDSQIQEALNSNPVVLLEQIEVDESEKPFRKNKKGYGGPIPETQEILVEKPRPPPQGIEHFLPKHKWDSGIPWPTKSTRSKTLY
jgi:transposase InsO family protein